LLYPVRITGMQFKAQQMSQQLSEAQSLV